MEDDKTVMRNIVIFFILIGIIVAVLLIGATFV
jgi:hypothetical protein